MLDMTGARGQTEIECPAKEERGQPARLPAEHMWEGPWGVTRPTDRGQVPGRVLKCEDGNMAYSRALFWKGCGHSRNFPWLTQESREITNPPMSPRVN